MAEQEILTEEGREKLLAELEYLETEKRAEIGERIKVAREFGDISENSEYDDAKNEQGMMEARIVEINRILRESKLVAAPKKSNKVCIGNTVSVELNGEKRDFAIVGGAESDIANNKISNVSPVGAALLGAKKGDEFNITGPTGKKINIKVLSFK